MSDEAHNINITGEPSINPQVCKFIVDHPILPDKSYNCRSKEMAEGSPLLEALFSINGIDQVMVTDNTLTISKTNHESWPEMGKKIGKAIRDTISSGTQLIASGVETKLPSEDHIRREIEALFEHNINPQIASHGGRVELVDVEGTKVYVRLGGGCQGCASANITLKQGIEKAIKQVVPEVTEVLDATDHSMGANPYYS